MMMMMMIMMILMKTSEDSGECVSVAAVRIKKIIFDVLAPKTVIFILTK
jgi:hypothetical protein